MSALNDSGAAMTVGPPDADRRIEALEAAVRRLRVENRVLMALVSVPLALVLLSALALAFPREATVQAGRFVLRDREGRARAVLATEGRDDDPKLSFLNPGGKKLLELAAMWDDSSGICFYDGEGRKRLELSMGSDAKGGSLCFYDQSGNFRIVVGTVPTASRINVCDALGNKRLSLGGGEDGLPEIRAYDNSGLLAWTFPPGGSK